MAAVGPRPSETTYDPGIRHKSARRGRERGCHVCIPARVLHDAGFDPNEPPPYYPAQRVRAVSEGGLGHRQPVPEALIGERFYVVELDGYRMGSPESRHASRAQTQLTCSVLDRLYCHREMARFDQPRGTILGVGKHRPKRAEARAWVRASAAAEAARLNALVAD